MNRDVARATAIKVLELDAEADGGPWKPDVDLDDGVEYWTGKFYCACRRNGRGYTWAFWEDDHALMANVRLIEYYRTAAVELARYLLDKDGER